MIMIISFNYLYIYFSVSLNPPLQCLRIMQNSEKGSARKGDLTSVSCVCLFYLNAAALCDLRGRSVICCSGAFLVSVSLYHSLQTSPYSDPGSASFSSEEFPKCVSLSRSLSGGGFSCTRSAPLNASVSSFSSALIFHCLKT